MAKLHALGSRQKGGPFLLYLLVVLGLAALGLAIYHYFTGSERVMPWQPEAELFPISATLSRFTSLFHTFRVPITGFLVSERLDVGLPVLRPPLAAVYLGILAVTLAVYFTIVSSFTRWPYIVGMALSMIFLATFNFDLLRVTQDDFQILLILVLGVLVLVSYGFHAFFTQVSLGLRFLAFSLILLVIVLIIGNQSQYSPVLSAMQLVHYSSLAAFVASGIFIFLVAFENIHALLWINTQGPSPQRRFGLWHFIIIGLLYLVNLLLLYLKNADIIQLDFIYVDPFIILLLSTVAGYWGWQRREVQYQRFITFKNGVAYIYLALAINCLLSISYAFATANTPLISAYTDVIVYTHLAYGFLFFLYILLNFYKLIQERLAVYKVVFDPKQLPFFTVYIMGSLLLLALVFRSTFSVYNKAEAGYYNYLGDFYKKADNLLLAERFYTEGTNYSHHNLKSTYALAGLYRERSYGTAEINLLKDALTNNPNEKVYSRMAATQSDKKDFFNHLFLLNQGLRAFPSSTALLTNKALLYETTTLADSTAYFYSQALEAASGKFQDLVQSNRLAFFLKNKDAPQALAVAEQTGNQSEHPALQSNLNLLQIIQEKPAAGSEEVVVPTKPLTAAEFALYYHNTLQHIGRANAQTIKQLNRLSALPGNAPYQENLILLKALAQFNAGQINEARNTLENQALASESTAGYYYFVIGSWLMEQKLYDAATSYFQKARDRRLPEAELPYLYALAHTADKGTAYAAAQQASNELTDPEEKAQATFLATVLNITTESVLTASDSLKVAYLTLYQPELTTSEFENVVNTVANGRFKALAQRELAQHYLQTNNLNAAQQTINTALAAAQGDNSLVQDLNLLRANVFAKQGNATALNKLVPTLPVRSGGQNEKLFYQAVATEKTNPKQAGALYRQVPQALIYNEEAVLAAANYFSKVQKNDNQAYNLLLSSIKYNPFSARLYQAYIFTSIKLGFIDFAQTAAEELKSLLSPAEYAIFRTNYEQKLKEKQESFPGWN
ncbi:tetratricopeptide repeat protein [Adhaeribacter pallidiroseus]|uniref:Tetratricopeptide repeat protein n=1 Tax=Adhaeribacter pallidiroseus TaxID=2072847 RepID=A0A369QJJ9_9BACT|nr:hypothetical protein [Adhaeribacter pallidiroseus]RDC64480.1 hypothetical protein AHMF7616_03094 [Adhaeribacter pallidiroseus]